MSIRHALPAALSLLALPASVAAQDHSHHADHSSPPAKNWQVSSHSVLTVASNSQEGPRGGDKTYLQGMVMLTAQRSMGERSDLTLEAMLSPDPFMGKNGYPLLLQTGETADGVNHLIDRQHPHDLFMGLTAKLSHRFDNGAKASVLIGYPGEFAFGPGTFMHRRSGESLPTAPISHHWFDSGHITMGVVTAGLETGPLKLEASQFTGREPDERRFDLEPVRLDSTSLRATWQATLALTLQASWARQVSPEQLHPDDNVIKTSLSAAYSRSFSAGTWHTTLAWARKEDEEGHFACTTASLLECSHKPADAYLFENSFAFNGPWTGLLRYERVYNDELGPHPAWVAKTEIGAMRSFALNPSARLDLGLVRQFNSVPEALEASYGGDPQATVAFMTLTLHTGQSAHSGH